VAPCPPFDNLKPAARPAAAMGLRRAGLLGQLLQ